MTEPTPPLDPAPAVAQAAPDVSVTLELGDFVDRIPPSFLRPGPVNRQQPVVFHASDLYSDLARGRASVPLSVIHAVCGEIFAKPVSSTEDVEVLLPLQKLVEQMSSSLKPRGDQIQDEDVGQIDTPFLQVALEDQARLPQRGAATPITIAAPAPVTGQKPPTGPIPVAAPSFGQIRPPSGPVPLAATEAPPPPPAAMPQSPAPIMGEAAPGGKRLPSTVRASVSGGKIRLSGPSLPGQRPAVVPAGFGTAPIPARPIVSTQQQAPVTALTSKKTARIQLPPIALRSSASTAGSAPPVFNKTGAPPPVPVRPASPVPPPASRAPIGAPPSAFRTPTVPSTATPPPISSAPVPLPTAPPSLPVPEVRAPLPPAMQQPVRTTNVPAPNAPGAVEPPPLTAAVPTTSPAPTSRVPLTRRSEPTPIAAPAPVAPLPPRPSASSAGLEAPARAAAGPTTQIQLSLAAILRALPATALGEGMTLVDDSVRITLPFALVEPQLAQGRVSIAREQFLAVLPDDFRDRFASNCELGTIPIPLQEIFQNLPMNALAMREDQIVPETGPEIPTPFGQKAAEDAQRLQTDPVAEAAAPALEAPPRPSTEHIPVVGPETTGLTPIAATVAPTPAIPTAPLPVPPKVVAPVMKIERVAPPTPAEPPVAPPPLPPMVAPLPVVPVPAVPIARAPEPAAPVSGETEAPVRTTTRIVLGASSAPVTVQPTLKPTQLHDPIAITKPKTETTSVALAPVTEEDVTERQPPGMAELQSIFMTDETLDAKKVVRLVSKLPGITACTIMFSDGLTLAGNFPKELDGEGFSAMSPQFFRRAVAFTTELNLGEMQTYSVYTDRVVLSFFMQEDICLSVMQTGRSFLPGVREKLMCVTTELSRMYARAGAN
jgi:predicted regulator of Ras-like GTPase activity (Roadblock/LC7/MglB family)